MSIIKIITRYLFPGNIKKTEQQSFYKLFAQFSHDLKGNLIAIRSSSGNIQKNLSSANVEDKINNIERALSGIDKKINHSLTLINMMTLFSSSASSWPIDASNLSITNCIQQAIQDHPFASDKHTQLINMAVNALDFSFTGNKNLIHAVFYCLIKNALRSFYNRGDGEAIIELINNNNQNEVHFTFPDNIETTDSVCEYNLFALGTPENPENGFYVIADMLKSMNSDIAFKRRSDGILAAILTFTVE